MKSSSTTSRNPHSTQALPCARLQHQIQASEEDAGMAPRRSPRLHTQIEASEKSAGVTCRRSPRLHPQTQESEDGAGVTRRRSPRLHPQIEASEEGAGATRRIRRRRGTSPASLLDADDMLREILLRLPPQPSSLPRASAVCKRWRGLVTDPRFLRQFYAHHRKPPILGVFSRGNGGRGIVFNPILDPPDRIPPQRFNLGRCSSRDGYDLLDCRHGLVLVKNRSRREVVVCDPITSEQRRVAIPPTFKTPFLNGVVLCAAGDLGRLHGACHSRPFKVVLVSTCTHYYRVLACVYSSESGIWGNLISIDYALEISGNPAVLVGNCLYWLPRGNSILEFDLSEHRLTLIRGPTIAYNILLKNRQIIQTEDGAVGYATVSYPRFQMWQRNANGHGVATWVLWKTIEMDIILQLPPQNDEVMAFLLGYDEDSDVIFLSASGSIYMVELKSMQSRKLYETIDTYCYHPFKSFYTPGTSIDVESNGAEVLHTIHRMTVGLMS